MSYNIDFKNLKREIDLTQYAAFLGYKIDKKKSTRTSVAMLKDRSDKIVISRSNGTWIYFSVYDDSDNGTIIDFVKNRTNRSVRDIGRELEGWLGTNPQISNEFKPVKEKGFEPKRIERLFNYCKPAYNNAYLHGRGIPNELLRSERFFERVFQDQFKNAVFPHFKRGRVCGLELKGEHADLFVRGSEKTLWRSNRMIDDQILIIAETPIDAMSYEIIHQLKDGFYIATCGGFSKSQADMIRKLVSEFDWIKSILIITDNDKGGDKITSRLEILISSTDFAGEIRRHSPDKRGCDWNDVLNQLGV
ncbi:MAG: toprim domain-containing protein [Reichenbachiella sp.]|uniref:toprim domain-containing protein n=1 Tax=Reichenbachiella sp. TaxID=2184521 RepID=UPI00329A7289